MPSMAEVLGSAPGWSTLREVVEASGGPAKGVASQLRLAVSRGWAEARFEDGRGTVYRAVPGWEALMGARLLERLPMPPRPSPVRDAILSALEGGPMTSVELAEAVGMDRRAASSRLHQLRRDGLVRSRPAGRLHGGRSLLYALSETFSEEAPGMGDEKKKDKDKGGPFASKECEELEMDPRNEP